MIEILMLLTDGIVVGRRIANFDPNEQRLLMPWRTVEERDDVDFSNVFVTEKDLEMC